MARDIVCGMEVDPQAATYFSDYGADRQFRRAVESEFEIIGEALGRLERSDVAIAERIKELPRIISFRNRIIHGYDTVDHATVWGIIEGHLPALLEQTEALLREGKDDA